MKISCWRISAPFDFPQGISRDLSGDCMIRISKTKQFSDPTDIYRGNFSTIYPLFKRSDPLGRRKSPNWKLFLKNRNAPYFVLNISAKENINKLSGRVVNLFPYWFQLSHACMLEQKKDTVYLEQWKFQINRLFQVKMNQVWFKKEKFKKKPIQSCLLPMPQNLPKANWFNSGFPINISNTRKWPLCIKVGKLQ